MSVIDDFFALGTWRDVAEALKHRRWEILNHSAREGLVSRLRTFATSSAATCVINAYRRILNNFALGDQFSVMRDTSALPKLTNSDLARLAKVIDAASAREFMDAAQEMALQLVCSQVLHGADFWRLLLASAKRGDGATSTTASQPVRATICVQENGVTRKLCKILPLSDGGFAVTAPYHRTRKGFLMKLPRVTEVGLVKIRRSLTVPYEASDRVKLSYHVDGFVQVSGEDNTKIVSGRDSQTGRPRGLGLLTCPLDEPARSGPSVGCSAWGLDDFVKWKPRNGDCTITFEEGTDFYEEPQLINAGHPGLSVQMFPIPSKFVDDAIGSWETGDRIIMIIPMNIYNRLTPLPVRLVRSGPACALALIAHRHLFAFPYSSGFNLAGPSDTKYGMMAIYPAMDRVPADAISLDRRPAASP
jgi:hypothetical protein